MGYKSNIERLEKRKREVEDKIAEIEPYCYNPENINKTDFFEQRRKLDLLRFDLEHIKTSMYYEGCKSEIPKDNYIIILDPRHKQRFN